MRSAFDREMLKLLNDVNSMGARVDSVIRDTHTALKNLDFLLAQQIYESDNEVDEMEITIEREAISVIALQQPVASDLRKITATLKMVTDIERIGDQCADICEIMNSNPNFHQFDCPEKVLLALEKAREMFSSAMEAFMQRNMELAKEVIRSDDIVDNYFDEIVQDMTNIIIDVANKDSSNSALAVDYLFIGKYIERIGDHATNIAEWALYEITGDNKYLIDSDEYEDEDDEDNEE